MSEVARGRTRAVLAVLVAVAAILLLRHLVVSRPTVALLCTATPVPQTGQLIVLNQSADHALTAADMATGEETSLGSTGVPAAGCQTMGDLRASVAPGGGAIAMEQEGHGGCTTGLYLAARSLQPGARAVQIAAPSAARMPTSYVWSPDSNAIMYVEAVFADGATPPPGSVVTQTSGHPVSFELRVAKLEYVSDGMLGVAEDRRVWRADASSLRADSVEVVGWNPLPGYPVSERAALVARSSDAKARSAATLLIVDLATRRIANQIGLEDPAAAVVAAADGQWVAYATCAGCGSTEGRVFSADLDSGQALLLGESPPGWRPSGLAISKYGSNVAWLESDGSHRRVRVAHVNASEASAAVTIAEGDGAIHPLVYSQDERQLVVDRGVADSSGRVVYPVPPSEPGAPVAVSSPPGEVLGWTNWIEWPPSLDFIAWTADPSYFLSAVFADYSTVVETHLATVAEVAAAYGFDGLPNAAPVADDIVGVALADVWSRCPVCEQRGPPKPADSRWVVVLWRDPPAGSVWVTSREIAILTTPDASGKAPTEPRPDEKWESPARFGVAPVLP
jgi:hypothetical protein